MKLGRIWVQITRWISIVLAALILFDVAVYAFIETFDIYSHQLPAFLQYLSWGTTFFTSIGAYLFLQLVNWLLALWARKTGNSEFAAAIKPRGVLFWLVVSVVVSLFTIFVIVSLAFARAFSY